MVRLPVSKYLLWGFLPLIFLVVSALKKAESKSIDQKKKFQNQELWAKNQLDKLSLEERIAQFFMVATWSNKSESHQAEIEKLVREDKIGGLIYFQGERENLKKSIQRMQLAAKTPLLIGMDAEWGIAMRISEEERFPYAYTVGQANDAELTKNIAEMMAQECRELGIHLNFSPVADVNSNPKNPVIGFRAYGENPTQVSKQVSSLVSAFEKNGILSCLKHFPGHGDTDKDSHYDLPTISKSKSALQSNEFVPFQAGIKAGASTVMMGHLNIPALDNSGTPSSLSKTIIQDVLRSEMKFEGLVISDALNMKAVSAKYGKTDVVVKAFQAGCDILLYPESVTESIQAIKKAVERGEISKAEIDARCLRVLKAKHRVLFPNSRKNQISESEQTWLKKQIYQKAITLVQHKNQVLPLQSSGQRIAKISIGTHTNSFAETLDLFAKIDHFHFFTVNEAIERMKGKWNQYDVIISAIHPNSVRTVKNYGMPGKITDWLEQIPEQKKHILVQFGNPFALEQITDFSRVDALIVGFENHELVQERVGQQLFGALPFEGKLQWHVSDLLPKGKGISLESIDRLAFSQPEELGISAEKLTEIDQIVNKGIKVGAFPGCQVLAAVEGKIIYRKSFGTTQFENGDSITENHVYDIASVSKIVGSTAALMKLQSEGKLGLQNKLKDFIPEVTGNGDFGNIVLRDMMAHQAGLTSWIPFYKKTLKNGELNPAIYSKTKKEGFETQVAKDVWISDAYTDTIYQRILASGLNSAKKYEYSDLGYYFVKKIVEKKSEKSFDSFLYDELYFKLGLQTMRFNPLNYLEKKWIVPTENDQQFRKQLVHGFVHDPGAAMLGGVGGHAGIFSNSYDLATMMQLFLNKGSYAGVRYLDEDVVSLYTKAQNAGNRRGAGFDRPTLNPKSGPTCEWVSQQSFGHSGFTGTFAWADPQNGINYVFLSNRVCPSAENWKIRDMNIRTEIQRVIYEAVRERKK